MTHLELFKKFVGRWDGTCRTWFEPDKLADESNVSAQITSLFGGRFVRHVYEGTIQGKPRNGEELIGFNTVTKAYQSSWIDDFHMNYAIMFSQGKATDQGFKVFGSYDVAEGQPPWGWRTEFTLEDDDHLTVVAYNVAPDGKEAKAIETVYGRINSAAVSND